MTTMIALVGEQPIPNVLPVRHYHPERVLLVYTDKTAAVAQRLQGILPGATLHGPVEAFNIADTEQQLHAWIQQHVKEGESLLFNITGGTKLMSLMAYRLAEQLRSTAVYLETGKSSIIYTYQFLPDGTTATPEQTELPTLIDIDTYLRAHIDTYQSGGYANDDKGGLFERALHQALEPAVDEVLTSVKIGGALDIDLVVRIGNRVGIIEAKAGSPVKKRAIEQLNTAVRREYLGIYTSKFLVMGKEWNSEHTNLRELAQTSNITVIELPGYTSDGETGQLPPEDTQQLVDTVREKLC